MLARRLSAVFVLSAACAAHTGEDSTSVGEDSTSAEAGEVSDGTPVDLGDGDPFADCDAYCDVWILCTDAFDSFEMCRQQCEDDLGDAALGGPECFDAWSALVECVGGLDCATLPDYAAPGGACEAENAAVTAGCG